MEKPCPKVSIIMGTYNRVSFIGESLKSIQNQSYSNWECLIIDDGSNDNTREYLQSILKTDARFKYFQRGSNHKKGLPGCRNYGIGKASGNFIIFFDDDDIVHPENLSICVRELQNVNFSYCRFLRSTFTNNFNYKYNLKKNYKTSFLAIEDLEGMIKGEIPFNSCQVLWRKECFENNKFNESLMYAEEWECYSRILLTGVKGINVEKILFFGRKHENSNTGEFWKCDPIRRESKIRSVKLVLQNLKNHGLLSHTLVDYFVRLGIFLKEESLVRFILDNSGLNRNQKIKFWVIYKCYPVLAFGHRIKKKFKKGIN